MFIRYLYFGTFFILLSCAHKVMPASTKNAPEQHAQNVKDEEIASNSISFKADGQSVVTKGWNVSQFKRSGGKMGLNITSDMYADNRTINVNLENTVPGIYTFPSHPALTGNYGSYIPDYKEDQFNAFAFTEGSFQLQEVNLDKNYVSGTFQGTVRNKAGRSIRITEGKFYKCTLTKLK